nr:lysm domain-containing protein [Quercus suber]
MGYLAGPVLPHEKLNVDFMLQLRVIMNVLFLWLAIATSCVHAATLFNGSEALVMPTWTPSNCLNAFKTAISCDQQLIQLLVSPDDQIGYFDQAVLLGSGEGLERVGLSSFRKGAPLTFTNGTSLPMDWITPGYSASGPNGQNAATAQGNIAGQDWYLDRTGSTYSNYGWPYPLNFDEYPIQIQCSSCFLQKLSFGIASMYGNTYESVFATTPVLGVTDGNTSSTMTQVWANIQANCEISTSLKPANDFTGYNILNGTAFCQQYLTASDPNQNASMLSLAKSVPLAAILEMNDLSNVAVGSAPLCAPLPCKLAVLSQGTSAPNFVSSQPNITLLQFLSWNPYARANDLGKDESVCVGPPGGAYQPAKTTAANATVYSTTARPAAPTLAGTIPYCGLWYNVTTGDYCNLISQKFGITLDQLISMNTAIFKNCSNLYLGYDYCMAPCCGSSIPSSASTTAPPTSSTMSASGTSTYASPPGPTQSGASNKCYKCLETTVARLKVLMGSPRLNSITGKSSTSVSASSSNLQHRNPEVDANCDIQAGVAYCINGPPLPTSTFTTTRK